MHNPLGADSIIISGIADRVAARTRGLLFPAIKLTQCPANTAHFQGTISIRPEVMTMYYADVLRNLLRIGFRKILILNGHDGKIGPGRGAIGQVADEIKDSAMLFVNWWEFLPEDMSLRRPTLFSAKVHGGRLAGVCWSGKRSVRGKVEKAGSDHRGRYREAHRELVKTQGRAGQLVGRNL
jgi:creatinine amidohydrolase/Fe(II)-dependent formamide hydrolase-like protein